MYVCMLSIVLYIVLYLSISVALLTEVLPTTSIYNVSKFTCQSAVQATVSEGLAQFPSMAARAGFEPVTLRSKGVVSTNAPPFPTSIHSFMHSFILSGHFYSAPSSPLLLGGAPDYSMNTVSEFHAKAHRQL